MKASELTDNSFGVSDVYQQLKYLFDEAQRCFPAGEWIEKERNYIEIFSEQFLILANK
jgi:hypothetical protein